MAITFRDGECNEDYHPDDDRDEEDEVTVPSNLEAQLALSVRVTQLAKDLERRAAVSYLRELANKMCEKSLVRVSLEIAARDIELGRHRAPRAVSKPERSR